METLLLSVVLAQCLIFGFFCSYVAKEKNKDLTTWFCLGFFFSFVALIALAAVPKAEPKTPYVRDETGDIRGAAGRKSTNPLETNTVEDGYDVHEAWTKFKKIFGMGSQK